jgi:hypothetical protein
MTESIGRDASELEHKPNIGQPRPYGVMRKGFVSLMIADKQIVRLEATTSCHTTVPFGWTGQS